MAMNKGMWVALAVVLTVLFMRPSKSETTQKQAAPSQSPAIQPPIPAPVAKNVLQVKILKVYPSGSKGQFFNVDMQARNTSGESLKHAFVKLALYDSANKYLGATTVNFSELEPGSEQIEKSMDKVEFAAVDQYKIQLSGIVNAKGLRDDSKWKIEEDDKP